MAAPSSSAVPTTTQNPIIPQTTTNTTSAAAATTTTTTNPSTTSSSATAQNNESFIKEALEVVSLMGPYKHLWSLLSLKSTPVSHDIIHQQLKQRCNKIISVLIPYKGEETKRTTGKLPTTTSSSVQTDAKEKLKSNMKDRFKISDGVAIELLCSYLVHEYNGLEVGLNSLLTTQKAQSEFLSEIEKFYKRERLCLIYCSQVILASALDEDHVYHAIFGGFIASASMPDWTKWLSLSIPLANCEEERIELIHSLALLIHHYSIYDGVLAALNSNYSRVLEDHLTPNIKLAEGLLVSSIVHCTATNRKDERIVEEFLLSQLESWRNNDYVTPHLAYYFFGKELENEDIGDSGEGRNGKVKARLLKTMEDRKIVQAFTRFVQSYSQDGVKYRYGIGPLALANSFKSFEPIIDVICSVGLSTTKEELFQLLDAFLKNKEIAHEFLIQRPPSITSLYQEAIMSFPVEMEFLLSYWGSFIKTANEGITALEILETATQLECLAEPVETIDPDHYDVLDAATVLLVVDRKIGNVKITSGTRGSILTPKTPESNVVVSWEIDGNSDEEITATVWQILSRTLLKPALQLDQVVPDDLKSKICALGEFLLDFGEFSSNISGPLLQLFPPVCHLLRKMELYSTDPGSKSFYTSLTIKLVTCASKFEMYFLREQAAGLWPVPGSTSNLISEMIQGYESSTTNTSYPVTKSFIATLTELIAMGDVAEGGAFVWKNELYISGVKFLLRSILPSFIRWRFARVKDRYEIFLGCLRVFHSIFNLPEAWDFLKRNVCRDVIKPNSSLLVLLEIDEGKLQDARILPTSDNYYLEDTLQLGLSLVLRIMGFDMVYFEELDSNSRQTLTTCMTKLSRHRVISSIPALAISILAKIAKELDVSILGCIGAVEVEIFRDLIMQRLSYRSEDTALRVAILEFLAVSVQTQHGLINHFLKDEELREELMSLLEEEDNSLPPSALAMIRALVGKGVPIMKKISGTTVNIWEKVSYPIRNLTKFNMDEQKNIITYTMNIFTFELYRDGLSDQDLYTEIVKLLEPVLLESFFKISLLDTNSKSSDDACKSILSLKHMLTLITTKSDLTALLPQTTTNRLSDYLTEEFWKNKKNPDTSPLPNNNNNDLSPPLSELILLLSTNQSNEYLKTLTENLIEDFFEEKLSVQISLLATMNRIIGNLKKDEDLSPVVVNNLVNIMSKIFENSYKVYEEDGKDGQPLVSISASMAYNITKICSSKIWLPSYHKHMLVMAIVHVAHLGLMKSIGPEIILECLGSLIKLTQNEETSITIRNSNLTQKLWIPALKYGSPTETKDLWVEVYLMCCELNTVVLNSEKHLYLDECLNFWSYHGSYLSYRLYDLPDIINICFANNNSDKNLKDLISVLNFNYFTLHSISAMLPYFLRWQLEQGDSLNCIMEGLFATVQASVGLLTQPNHLLLLITRNPKGTVPPPITSYRLSPQLVEVQNKLWDIMLIGVHNYLKMSNTHLNYIECHKLLPLLYNMISLPIKILTKQHTHHGSSEKRSTSASSSSSQSQPAISSSKKVVLTLEKGLTLLLIRVKGHLDTLSEDKRRLGFQRECSSEVTNICDSVKRLNLPPDSYSIKICSLLEGMFRET